MGIEYFDAEWDRFLTKTFLNRPRRTRHASLGEMSGLAEALASNFMKEMR